MSPTLRVTLVMLLAFLGSAGCAARRRADSLRAAKTDAPALRHEIVGRVSFEADYRVGIANPSPPDPESLVPVGHAPVPLLRICAIRQVGWNDLVTEQSLVDDEILGCAATDREGRFRVQIDTSSCTARGECKRTVYLASDLCSRADGRLQACVTANALRQPRLDASDWTRSREYRKFMWSRPVGVSIRSSPSTLVSWNLSCPLENGTGASDVTCESAQSWGRNHRRGSNLGKNVEAVHVYVAMAQTIATVGTLFTGASTTDADDGRQCGDRDGGRKEVKCNDVVRVVIRQLRRVTWKPERECASLLQARKRGLLDAYDDLNGVCMGTQRDPFIVAHELGHLLHARWLDLDGSLGTGASAPNWRNGTDEKSQVTEGFANFVGAMTWYPRNARNPKYQAGHLEPPRTTCSASPPAGEGPVAAFFWDLWDDDRPDEPDDRVQEDFATILRVWSRFHAGSRSTGEHGANECGPDGRNLLDYAYHWGRKGKLPRITPLLEGHCLHLQERRYVCPRP